MLSGFHKRVICIGALIGAGCLALGVARGDLIADGQVTTFQVGGLWAEDLNAETYAGGGKFFEAAIYQKPLIEPRRRVPMVAPPSGVAPVIEVSPSSGRAADSLRTAEAYAAGQDWKMALAAIQAALDEEPNNLMLLRRAAAYAALARKFGVADEYFRRALEQDPKDIAFLAGRAGVLLRLARLQEAEQLAERALAIQPRYLSARFVLTCSRIARDGDVPDVGGWERLFTEQVAEVAQWLDADRADYEAVLTAAGFQKACDIMVGPESGQRIGEVAMLLKRAAGSLQRRQWQDALSLLQSLEGLRLRAMGIRMDMARCLFDLDKKEEAEKLLRDLVRRYPDMPIVHFNHGVALIRLSRFEEAARAVENALKLDPNSNYSFFAMACCYAGMGDMDKAWTYMRRIAPEVRSQVEEWAKGDDAYLKAIRGDPRYADFVRSGVAP
jgi:tetratricopeptide (TPR) repeat protein